MKLLSNTWAGVWARTQTGNKVIGTCGGATLVSIIYSYRKWDPIKRLTIIRPCNKLLGKHVLPKTSKDFRKCIRKSSNSFLKHGFCPKKSTNYASTKSSASKPSHHLKISKKGKRYTRCQSGFRWSLSLIKWAKVKEFFSQTKSKNLTSESYQSSKSTSMTLT
jgi:hypothetical protein